jgi:hypothetical protein
MLLKRWQDARREEQELVERWRPVVEGEYGGDTEKFCKDHHDDMACLMELHRATEEAMKGVRDFELP